LVFCAINAFAEGDPVRCRLVTDQLRGLDLVGPEALAGADDPTAEVAPVMRYVLRHHGFTDDEAGRMLALLATIGRRAQARYEGRMQRFLRRVAEAARDELVTEFAGDDPPAELRRAVAHWLQNTVNLPLSLDDAEMREFCIRSGSFIAASTISSSMLMASGRTAGITLVTARDTSMRSSAELTHEARVCSS
jgi:hypothetical protein